MTKPTSNLLESVPAADPETRSRKWWLWLAVPVASGIVLGLAWWLLAPGGLNLISGNSALADPTASASRLPRDLVFAGLMLLAGCFTAVLLDGKVRQPGQGIRTFLAVLGGMAGALVGLAGRPARGSMVGSRLQRRGKRNRGFLFAGHRSAFAVAGSDGPRHISPGSFRLDGQAAGGIAVCP
ncbi:hypothetical protein [Arthrobacter sp. NA-172]|uniref:hypothetical protein n=1 Tax=Arthrobacter sp. NA-172 TaxID=3367524 RepID=UPI0037553793